MTKFRAILADPPWRFKTYSEKGRGRCADKHYPCMGLESIKCLDVEALAAKDSVLFLWTTMPFLQKAFEVIRAWGFTYKTVAFVWAKSSKTKKNAFVIGTGYWTRANAELCLLATKGHPKRRRKDVPQLIVAPRREHSRKPDEIYPRIKKLVKGPYLELFARQKWSNEWSVWGNEFNSDVDLEEKEVSPWDESE